MIKAVVLFCAILLYGTKLKKKLRFNRKEEIKRKDKRKEKTKQNKCSYKIIDEIGIL